MGMTATDSEGNAKVKKRTSVITSSSELANELRAARCDGAHRHIRLVDGGVKASQCQVYPDAFCRAICRGYSRQIDAEAASSRRSCSMVLQSSEEVGYCSRILGPLVEEEIKEEERIGSGDSFRGARMKSADMHKCQAQRVCDCKRDRGSTCAGGDGEQVRNASAAEPVLGVKQSQERQDESTRECNDRIRAKEEERQSQEVTGDPGRNRSEKMDQPTLHPHAEEVDCDALYKFSEFFDDVKG